MSDEQLNRAIVPSYSWQQRRGGVQVYFCYCPFALLLAPFLIVARLLQYGISHLFGDPVKPLWAQLRVTPITTSQEAI